VSLSCSETSRAATAGSFDPRAGPERWAGVARQATISTAPEHVFRALAPAALAWRQGRLSKVHAPFPCRNPCARLTGQMAARGAPLYNEKRWLHSSHIRRDRLPGPEVPNLRRMREDHASPWLCCSKGSQSASWDAGFSESLHPAVMWIQSAPTWDHQAWE